MLRHRLFQRFGVLVSLVLLMVMAGPRPSYSAQAQESTPEANATPAASTGSTESSFVAGSFRIGVVAAQRADAIDSLGLPARGGKDWIVVVADVSNWSTKNATLPVKEFAIRFTGGADPKGFAATSTKTVAAALGVEPKNVNAGVKIAADKTARVAFVFQVDKTGANPAVIYNGQALPLAAASTATPNFNALPEIAALPGLVAAKVKDVADGATLTLDDGSSVRLALLDAPQPAECFGGQSASRLKKLAGQDVELEAVPDGSTLVWADQSNGTRRLLNYELVVSGFAALKADATGSFAAWLSDGEQTAKTKLAGLWGACTSAHGVAKTEGPERSVIAVRSGDTDRDYQIWGVQSWSPLLVTTPDGGAWAFFSAQADDGPDKGKGKLYATQYDPSTGSWTPATAIAGGDLDFGPDAVVDSRGLVHLVYSDRNKDDPSVFATLMYTHEEASGGWSTPVAIAPSNDAGHQIAPSLAIDKNGTLHVLWQDQRAFSPEARAASALNADIYASDLPPGGSWSEPVQVNKHIATAAGSRPQVVADGDRLVAVWSVYTSATGATNAARIDGSFRPLGDPNGWAPADALVVGRGEKFGGRGVDLAADPNGGAVLVYSRQVNDSFLFARRLKPDSTEWGGDVLITAGDRGTYPSIAINKQGVVYITYNVGTGSVVDVGASAIAFRSIQPGPEKLMTQDDPNTQGISNVTTDTTGSPWLVYFSENPGSPPNKVYVLRNAVIPTS